MRKYLLVSNIVLIVAVVVLYVLFIRKGTNCTPTKVSELVRATNTATDSLSAKECSVAFFEMDSVEAKYKYYQEVKKSLMDREKQIQNTLVGYQKSFNNKLKAAHEKGANLSQNEQATIQQELENMQREYAQKEQSMKDDLMMESVKKMQKISERIQNVAATIAKEQGYSYVLSKSHNAGSNVIFYSDDKYNITAELLKRLNESK